MVWYSHLFKNFPQFIVTHTVKGFGIVNKVNFFFIVLARILSILLIFSKNQFWSHSLTFVLYLCFHLPFC